jgi:hypothetical protein
MPDPIIAVVNASHVVHDDEVRQWTIDIEKQIHEDFAPIWNKSASLIFRRFGESIPDDAWPIYINKHSTDLTALGWHDDNGKLVFGRIFAQDCLDAHISVSVDLSHEILEIIGDPDIKQTITLPDGRMAALEMCDPVEDDLYGYRRGETLVSDFVLPSYFHPTTPTNAARWDFMNHLTGPCPALTSGGYQSLYVNGEWLQAMSRQRTGLFSHRSLRHGRNYRRVMGRAAK